MRGQPEVPRWRRKQQQPATQVTHLKGKAARQYAQAIARQAQYPVHPSAHAPVPGSTILARTGGFRFRKHLIPFGWLAVVAAAGLALPLPGALLGAGLLALLIVAFSWRLPKFARQMSRAAAALTLLLVPLLSAYGWTRPWPVVLALGWLTVAVPWVVHYKWRPSKTEVPDTTDADVWAALAAKRKWSGQLGTVKRIPGGVQHPILLNGAETNIGEVMAHPRAIAAAWDKPVTEAYAEPDPAGIESRGLLTLLKRSTLDGIREWDRAGIDLEAGIATVGVFPDGMPVHERYFIRRNGVRHTITAGADGSGKTGLLDLGLCMSAMSGIIAPVILDPQQGQSLHNWRDHVPYACGPEECVAFLRGLHAAMMDRSGRLARFPWTDDDGREHRGMGFFDPFITGLPIVEITVDEAPALLKDKTYGQEAVWRLADIGKMGRKAGFRLRLAAQVPSLAEIGDQALRSILVGGNVFCLRTGDRVSSGMVGIPSDPHDLPKYFRDGSPTVGLGYTSGPDNRPSTPMRTLWVPDPGQVASSAKIRPLDEQCAETLQRAIAAPRASAAAPAPPARPALAVVPAPDDSAPEGRAAADAVWTVLSRDGRELERGEILKRAAKLAVTEWGRERPFSMRAIQNALDALCEGLNGRRITREGHGVYRAGRVGASAGAPGGEG